MSREIPCYVGYHAAWDSLWRAQVQLALPSLERRTAERSTKFVRRCSGSDDAFELGHHARSPCESLNDAAEAVPVSVHSQYFCRLVNAALRFNTVNTQCMCMMAPAPSDGIDLAAAGADADQYLSGLEVLTAGLPPTFLVLGVSPVISRTI